MIFCTNCGAKNSTESKFCTKCGKALAEVSDEEIDNDSEYVETKGSMFDSATSKLNSWTGGSGAVEVSWKDFFSEVFKSHTEDEAEDIFIAGTKDTTPSLDEVSNEEVHPWLFSRILAVIIIAGILLTVLTQLNQRTGDLIAADVIISIAVPMSALVLFFEINVFKNISFYKIGKIMLLGGILSLIVTIILDSFTSISALNLIGSLLTGSIEEISKVLIAAFFIQKLNIKRIFNGLLVGAAVGTGFSAFENIQYIVASTGQIASFTDAFQRTLLSISDHTEWCAIATAALIIAKGSQKLTTNTFMDLRFLKFLVLVILIHTCWDWNFFDNYTYIRYAILVVITWVTVFVMVHAGLREVKELQLSFDVDLSTNKGGEV